MVAGPLAAQTWTGVSGVLVTHSEVGRAEAKGAGGSAFVDSRRGRWRLQLSALRAHLTPKDSAAWDMTQAEARLGYRIRGIMQMELGAGRRWIAPAGAAQSVTMVIIGASVETHLSRAAVVWLRGSFLPLVKFGDGGSSGSSVEVGLGSALSWADGRWRVHADFGVQRFDRQLQGADLTLQTSFARVGVAMGFQRKKG